MGAPRHSGSRSIHYYLQTRELIGKTGRKELGFFCGVRWAGDSLPAPTQSEEFEDLRLWRKLYTGPHSDLSLSTSRHPLLMCHRPVSYGLKDIGESGKRDASGTRRLRSNRLIRCGNKRFATASSHHCQSGFLQQFRPIARRDFLCLLDEGSLFVRAEFRWRRSSRCNFYAELHEKLFLACRRTDAEKPGCA